MYWPHSVLRSRPSLTGIVSRTTKSRVQANASIAVRGLLCEQENHLSYVLKLPDLEIQEGEGEGEALSRILAEQIEQLQQPDTINIPDIPHPDAIASVSDDDRGPNSSFTFTDVYPSEKEPWKLRQGPRDCLKRYLLAKPRFAVDPSNQLPPKVLRTVLRWRGCIISEGPVMDGKGCKYRRRWTGPDTKIRICGVQEGRSNKTRSSSLISYQTTRPGDFGAVDTKLGEVEFFFTVEVPFANYVNHDDTETLYMAYVRKLPTVADGPLIRLESPAAFSSGGGAHEAILCENILDLARLIRSELSIYVIGRRSPLNLHFDH